MLIYGYSPYFADRVVKMRFDDFFRNKDTTLKQKIWAQRRGFFSDKIAFYGLTNENYRDYLSDFDYLKLHPINREYSQWIDDKLTMKYLLQPFAEFLPLYYYHICNQEILRLIDCPDGYGQSIKDIINLLKARQFLAAKKFAGSAGEGFIKLNFIDNIYLINNQISSESQVINMIDNWMQFKYGGYLITEYLHANDYLRNIWPDTSDTLRVTIARNYNQPTEIISALIRFGTKNTSVIDNALSGGVFCKVDVDTGAFANGKILKDGKIMECKYHPDTNAKVEGFVPYWDLVIEKVTEICSYIPQVRYMGIDVIIVSDGLKVIEMNSHPNIEFIQYDCPAYKNELAKHFYLKLVEEKEEQQENRKNNGLIRRFIRFSKEVSNRSITTLQN